jgi:cytoskeleton protein RodZ
MGKGDRTNNQAEKCGQADKLSEIGAQLKQARETQHIPLHQITSTTLIAERHLKAIEEGDLDRLPEPIYVQGFIRKYGQALGMQELAEDFPLLPSEPKHSLKMPKAELRPFHLYALYLSVIAIAVSLLANFFNQAKAPSTSAVKPNLSKSAQVKPPSKTKGGNLGKVGGSNLPPSNSNRSPLGVDEPTTELNKPINLGISTTDAAWLRVDVDGKIQFEGTLPKGSSRNWSADREIKVVAGNGGAVMVVLNEQSVGTLGKTGQVVEKVFNLGGNQAEPSPKLSPNPSVGTPTEQFKNNNQNNTQASPSRNSASISYR